ncbi:MAG: hypothetical protein CFE34_02910 [Rhodobacteraceae bacterium PARR1]|nr:MAG: hypothetical protein CFE34_02910 [Rhodobacteraceae bacterium PARR1]
MTDMKSDPPALPSQPYRVAALPTRKPMRFTFSPNVAERAALAVELGLLDLPALQLVGEIRAAGRNDYTLEAALTARVVQPCSITLAPVPAAISEAVRRLYVRDYIMPDGDEVELADDDSIDPLPEVIDVADVAREALALALPLYPRAPGAELGQAVFAEPGTAPLKDEDLRPFAGLAALKAKLEGGRSD